MRRPLPLFAALALVLSCAAGAQPLPPKPLPVAPDEKAYPQLTAMKRWLEGGSREARLCALTGGLYIDADRHYRETRSESQTIEAVMRPNQDKLTEPERERLKSLATNVAAMAVALHGLEPDSAAIAFSQMCASRAEKPGIVPAPDTIRAQFQAADGCQRRHSAGSLDRKECVARAFATP